MLLDFKERGREREREKHECERETSIQLPLLVPQLGPIPGPLHLPTPNLEDAMTNPAALARAPVLFFNSLS